MVQRMLLSCRVWMLMMVTVSRGYCGAFCIAVGCVRSQMWITSKTCCITSKMSSLYNKLAIVAQQFPSIPIPLVHIPVISALLRLCCGCSRLRVAHILPIPSSHIVHSPPRTPSTPWICWLDTVQTLRQIPLNQRLLSHPAQCSSRVVYQLISFNRHRHPPTHPQPQQHPWPLVPCPHQKLLVKTSPSFVCH